MGNVTLAEVESLARKILTTYFCDSDLEFLISTFADDIIWLGGGEKQKAEGKEAVAACFRSGKDGMIACDMSDETYHCMDLGGGAYLCEGVSWLRSKPGSEFYINMQQRVTFVFQEGETGLLCAHIHHSNPYQEMVEEIRKKLNFTTLRYHRLDDLQASIGISPCKLCTYCWNGKK